MSGAVEAGRRWLCHTVVVPLWRGSLPMRVRDRFVKLQILLVLLLSCLSSPVAADDAKSPAQIAAALGLKAADVGRSPIPDLYEVHKNHVFAYVTRDGRYLIQGDLIDLKTGEQITESHRRADRLQALGALAADDFITYAPQAPSKTRYTVTVFTDVTCPFCRRLHREMVRYNRRGIAIRYAFFPRSGPNTPAFAEAETVWCSGDRRAALDRAFSDAAANREIPADKTTCANPVLRSYRLGAALGLRGTPMMILPDGEKIDGYVPPGQLARHLQAMPGG